MLIHKESSLINVKINILVEKEAKHNELAIQKQKKKYKERVNE